MDLERLPGLIDAALVALGSDAASVLLSISGGHAPLKITMPPYIGRFGSGQVADTLAWERLVDELPKAVERARLAVMHAASGADPPAPWSVYTSATALAWLHMASRGTAGSAWKDAIAAILLAAEDDGDVHLAAPDGSTMHGMLRSRRMLAEIRLGPRLVYKASEERLTAGDTIPEAVAGASAGRQVAELVDAPWLIDADVRVVAASIETEGTLFALREELVPLETIPASARSAAPSGGPSYAPWIATKAERAALDQVDAAAHRVA